MEDNCYYLIKSDVIRKKFFEIWRIDVTQTVAWQLSCTLVFDSVLIALNFFSGGLAIHTFHDFYFQLRRRQFEKGMNKDFVFFILEL